MNDFAIFDEGKSNLLYYGKVDFECFHPSKAGRCHAVQPIETWKNNTLS